jgi:SOS-response transcriptional repressor LexA
MEERRATGRKRRDRGVLPEAMREEMVSRLGQLAISYRVLGERAELNISEVSRLLSGERGLTVEEAVRVAEVLGWHPAKLLPGAPPMPTSALDDLGYFELPVWRWGSCGDPRDRESAEDPDHIEPVPFGAKDKLDRESFGVMVQGESMRAREIHPYDTVWVNPNERARVNRVVLARAWGEHEEELGMVVKVLRHAAEYGSEALFSERVAPDGRALKPELYAECARMEVIGPVVWVTSGRAPGAPRDQWGWGWGGGWQSESRTGR